MLAEDYEVTLKILPSGERANAIVQVWQGLTLNLTFRPAEHHPILPGSLVEVSTPDSLHFGEVIQANGGSLEIRIEHSLNLHELDAIQAHWNRPTGSL